jgi:hypothetical protein
MIACVDHEAREREQPGTATSTWNDQRGIDRHRELSAEERVRLAIEASRAALRFATGRRVDER